MIRARHAPQIDVVARLRDFATAGSKSDQKLAAAILADPDFAVHAAIGQLAARAEISEATVTRFCRALGCAGTRDFKDPFALWDPRGLWADLVRWPSAMRPDNTHWSFYASEPVALLARGLLLGAVGLGALRLVRSRQPRAAPGFRYLAGSSAAAVLSGVAFHNNYGPWFTTWAACALVAAFLGPESASAQAPAASANK